MAMTDSHPLVRAIDQAFDRKSWHGTNLKGSIRGLSGREAAWRPGPGRHNIWELVLHCAYWKYVVRRRLLGESRGSFPRKGSNFPLPSGSDEGAWRQDQRLLSDTHAQMREAILRLGPEDMTKKPRGSKVDNLSIVSGVAAHDLYHAGQIQLLKRLGAKRRGT
jgi:uncharacterized damage-inducible protein DinB